MGIIDKIKEGINELIKEGEVVAGDRSKNTFFSSKKDFSLETEAREAFLAAKEKLFDVNGWTKIPALANSTFHLYDGNGFPLASKRVKVGDYIKILLPGPLPENWVKVIDLKDAEEFAEFTVKPSHDPVTSGDETVVEHFFHEGARSIFKVKKEGLTIIASEEGKNEAINNEGQEAGTRKVLNTMVSEGGWVGFQKYQWKNLTDFLVGKID